MQTHKRQFRTFVKQPKLYHSRQLRMEKEGLRGALRGRVARFRRFFPSAAKSALGRQIQRLLSMYQVRFGHDSFILEILERRIAPVPRPNWLPGGYAHWRSRITGRSSGSPAASAELQR